MSTQSIQVNVLSGSVTTEGDTTVSGTLKVEVSATARETAQELLDDLSQIYGDPGPRLSRVLALAVSAIDATKEAIEAEDKKDRFRADDYMLMVGACIGELFEFRGIGNGFAIVVAALTFAFINKRGLPFSSSEMYAVLRTLNAIRTAPFCSVEVAVATTEILESAGLTVDPIPLTDLLTDAQEAGFVDS